MMRTLQVPLKAAWDAAVAGAATDEAATAQRATRMRLADLLDIISTSVVCCPVGCHSRSVGTGNPSPNIYARRRRKFPRMVLSLDHDLFPTTGTPPGSSPRQAFSGSCSNATFDQARACASYVCSAGRRVQASGSVSNTSAAIMATVMGAPVMSPPNPAIVGASAPGASVPV